MSAITDIPKVSGTTQKDVTALRSPVSSLGQEDFLKLLVAQLSAQDPMNPQKDTEFIAQVAQFSSLEQTRAMQAELSGMRAEQQVQQAAGLIGRTVTVRGEGGQIVSGPVSGLNLETDAPRLVVNGTPYGLETVLSVSAPQRLY